MVAEKIIYTGLIIFVLITSSIPGSGADLDTYYTTIYIDGVNADSNGIKLLVRASERHSGIHFQPYIVDVDFILTDGDKEIFSERIRQVSVGETVGGTTEIMQPWYISLEDGKNYTAIAEIYLVENGKVDYIASASANFTAIMDGTITDIYGDGIGASATVKGKSMVPLDANIIFTLKQDGMELEKREAKAPYIMSNDREKTVDVLWSKSLPPGEYVIAAELKEKEVIARYDKTITVARKQSPVTPVTTASATPGFQSSLAISAILVAILARRNKK